MAVLYTDSFTTTELSLIDRTLSNWVYEFDKWAPTVVKVSYKVSLFHQVIETLLLNNKMWELMLPQMHSQTFLALLKFMLCYIFGLYSF